jgi:preprotein translocase subunit SecE
MTERTLSRNRKKQVEELEDQVLDNSIEDDEDDEDEVSTAKKGRITPGRRNQEEEVQANFLVRSWRGIIEYFSDVRSELAKVTWPTREEATHLTRIVVIALIVAAIVMGLLSLGMGELIRIGLGAPVLLAALFIIIVAGAVWYTRTSSVKRGGY